MPQAGGLRSCNAAAFYPLKKYLPEADFSNSDFVRTGEKEAAYARTGETSEGCIVKMQHLDYYYEMFFY
ncbi:MAG TPA: hypothetical protein VHP12_03925 [Chitinophagaceae bacterium]|nr:hypothetical protein [Chitinophagaceae bacterium]